MNQELGLEKLGRTMKIKKKSENNNKGVSVLPILIIIFFLL